MSWIQADKRLGHVFLSEGCTDRHSTDRAQGNLPEQPEPKESGRDPVGRHVLEVHPVLLPRRKVT